MSRQTEAGHGVERPLHLLIPVDATDRSRWGIRHALAQHRAGVPLRVSLLFVAVPPDEWRILRFRSEEEILRFQFERGKLLMDDAASELHRAGIEVDYLEREGDVVFHILDAAEQHDCDAIVMPVPYPRLVKLLSVDVAREVMRRQRAVPVVSVDNEGLAVMTA
ncbi:MAG TPA: universal stress protein [Noviherbaspirillum sp.]|uniref:universal stress protein n=1 Tax=Noviherbaspirillum sp. TaxID=1926288 RepID=UPI002B4A9260|nr:universal stress protein [Noviherbaspirillum sp.]HJV83864.1 universal stress protein [Noviherbaspirillum sp.]